MSTDLRAVALRRKLKSLQYPHTDSFDYLNEGSFRSLIAWLEDTKICHYKIEERESLRATDSDGWKHAFDTYLEDLQCNRTVIISLPSYKASKTEYGIWPTHCGP